MMRSKICPVTNQNNLKNFSVLSVEQILKVSKYTRTLSSSPQSSDRQGRAGNFLPQILEL
jgi:hypothetical protein